MINQSIGKCGSQQHQTLIEWWLDNGMYPTLLWPNLKLKGKTTSGNPVNKTTHCIGWSMELERWPNPGARWNMLWHRGRAANQQCHRGGWILGGPQEPQGLPRGPKLLFKTASQAYQPPVPVSCMFTSLASTQGQSRAEFANMASLVCLRWYPQNSSYQ